MTVTLSISASSLRLLTASRDRVSSWASVPLASGLVTEGLIKDRAAVAEAIDGLFDSVKASRRGVIVCVAALPFTYRVLTLPLVKASLREEAIMRSARREIPLPVDELYLSWQLLATREDEQDFFVLGVSRNAVNTLLETLAEAGLKHPIVDLKPLALMRAANRGNAIVVSLEADSFDVALVADGVPAVMHSVTPRLEGGTFDDNLRRLTDELTRMLRFQSNAHPESNFGPTSPVLLTGELASGDAGSEIEARVGHPVENLSPPMSFPAELPVGRYSTNMGLALKGRRPSRSAGEDVPRLDLDVLWAKRAGLREQLRQAPVAMSIVLVAGLFFPIFQAWNRAVEETGRLESQLTEAQQRLHQTRLAGNEAKVMQNALAEVLATVDALTEEHAIILAKGEGVSGMLALVRQTLPAEAWLTFLSLDATQVLVRGVTSTPTSVVSYANTLEETGAFSEVRISEISEVTPEGVGGGTRTSFGLVLTRQQG